MSHGIYDSTHIYDTDYSRKTIHEIAWDTLQVAKHEIYYALNMSCWKLHGIYDSTYVYDTDFSRQHRLNLSSDDICETTWDV
jgi:hypothetical protein